MIDNCILHIGMNKTGSSSIQEYVDKLCGMLSLPKVDEIAIFPLGNMFWARVNAIKGLFILNPKEVLEAEPLLYDGLYMHTIEHITPILVKKKGYENITVYKKDTTW